MMQEQLDASGAAPSAGETDAKATEVVEATHFVVDNDGSMWDDVFEPGMSERIAATAKKIGPFVGVALAALIIFLGVSQFNREQAQLAALTEMQGEMTWSQARVQLTAEAEERATAAAIVTLTPLALAPDVAQHATREATAVAVEAPDEVVQIFTQAACGGCHVIPGVPGAVGITGPSFEDLGVTAAERIDGYTAEEYIRESIVDPNAYIVPECPNAPCVAGVMADSLYQVWEDDQLALAIDYLASLGVE